MQRMLEGKVKGFLKIPTKYNVVGCGCSQDEESVGHSSRV